VTVFCCTRLIVTNDQTNVLNCSLLLNTAVVRRLVMITSGEEECQCLADQSRVGNLAACSRCPCKATIAHALHGKNELDLCMPTLWSLPTFKTWLRLRSPRLYSTFNDVNMDMDRCEFPRYRLCCIDSFHVAPRMRTNDSKDSSQGLGLGLGLVPVITLLVQIYFLPLEHTSSGGTTVWDEYVLVPNFARSKLTIFSYFSDSTLMRLLNW